jgi:hypothetical protein
MDWDKFAMTWGPAAPVIVFMGKLLWDAVYKIIPRGFRSIRRAMAASEEASETRHSEHRVASRRLLKLMTQTHRTCAKKKTPRRRLKKKQPRT